jgi:SAM-dependent methyltransferase
MVCPVQVFRASHPWDVIRNNQIISTFLKSGADYLVKMDIDQTYPKNYFEVMVPLLEKHDVIGPMIFDRWKKNNYMPLCPSVTPDSPYPFSSPHDGKTGIQEVPYLHTNCFYNRRVLEAIPPPWYEAFMSPDGLRRANHVDYDFMKKITDAGFKVHANNDMVVKHMTLEGIDREFYEHWNYTEFPGSENYWEHRYSSGGDSGSGMPFLPPYLYNNDSKFKAKIVNDFVKNNNVKTVMEFGCGDGNQLALAEYPSYYGLDVSPTAIELCRDRFRDDKTKCFNLMSMHNGEMAELTLSLDVIYHLVEDNVYYSYMNKLFDSSEQFVIICSSDFDMEQRHDERRRKFTPWVEANKSDWELTKTIANTNKIDTLSDFYIYEKKHAG